LIQGRAQARNIDPKHRSVGFDNSFFAAQRRILQHIRGQSGSHLPVRSIANDSFHAETNSCGICRDRRARVSFAYFSGTAVSARQTEFALGERDA
jgi:hypothetical protein